MELHLASMENVSCWAFRKLVRGPTDTYTGALSLNFILRKREWKEADLFPIQGQRQWMQIASSREAECKKFIERLLREKKENPEKYNVHGVQLNISCPSRNVTGIGQGAALIKRKNKVASMVNELLKQDEFKVSVKMRLGLNEHEVKQGRIFALLDELKKIDNPNFSLIVVHFKHARDFSYTPYDYSLLPKINEYNIPLIINGGINNYEDFQRIVRDIPDKKNILGFMMGRAALKNPDCFIKIGKILGKSDFPARTQEEIGKEFEDNCKIHLPKAVYIQKIQKYCPWAKGIRIEFPEGEKITAGHQSELYISQAMM